MPKLLINVDLELEAGPMSSGEDGVLSSAKLKNMIRNADPNDFSLSVAFLAVKGG